MKPFVLFLLFHFGITGRLTRKGYFFVLLITLECTIWYYEYISSSERSEIHGISGLIILWLWISSTIKRVMILIGQVGNYLSQEPFLSGKQPIDLDPKGDLRT